jgi:hypothetical protein
MYITQLDKHVAKKLGVTPLGLAVLARMVAGGGVGRTAGMAGQKLIKQGYVQEREEYGVQRQITDAGREIVQRAREMGW